MSKTKMDIAREAWNHGYESGRLVSDARSSVEAFGAIRRAVAEARAYDEQAIASALIGPVAVSHYQSSAVAIRDAIRAAIGSDKA